MPQPKKRSEAETRRAELLLSQAKTRTLEVNEVKELMWILNPFYDYPALSVGDRDFFFDTNLSMLYEKVGDNRQYVTISEDKLSSFGSGGGGGVNRGSGPFARLSADKSKLKVPLPPFPKVPANVKSKFPELKNEWETWESSVEEWLQYVQNQLS